MRKTNELQGYMTLKIELKGTGISRTIVVPAHMTLKDLNEAIQAVMGWEHEHLWCFTDNRRGDGVIYEMPHEGDDGLAFRKRLMIDPSKMPLRNAFPKRGAKLFYEYDFGDSWDHVVTRQADPKSPGIACVKSQGPDGIEDFGGQWRLAEFIEAMRANPGRKDFSDVLDWFGLKTAEDVARYLEGESAERKTEKLRAALAHVKPAPKAAPNPNRQMSDEEKARTLGLMFATLTNKRIWDILVKAMQGDGTCEFEDPDKDIGVFFLTMFEGLKVKDGCSTPFHLEPSRLTVVPEWVEMFKTHGKEWRALHEQFDILETYATSAVRLYGAVSIGELRDIIMRYDPGCNLSTEEMGRMLAARAVNCPQMPFRIDGDLVVSVDQFPADIKGVGKDIVKLRKRQADFPRWYLSTRELFFEQGNFNSFEYTPESDVVEQLLEKACAASSYDSA